MMGSKGKWPDRRPQFIVFSQSPLVLKPDGSSESLLEFPKTDTQISAYNTVFHVCPTVLKLLGSTQAQGRQGPLTQIPA